jgi:hypothetical protein
MLLVPLFNGKNILLQFFVILLFWVPLIFLNIGIEAPSGINPIYDLMYRWIAPFPQIYRWVFLLFAFGNTLLLNWISTHYQLISRGNYHLFYLLPLFTFSYASSLNISPALISMPFLLYGLFKIFSLGNLEKAQFELSSIAIILALYSMAYWVMLSSFLLLALALLMFRPFKYREWMIILVSFSIPYFYLFTGYFVADQLQTQWNEFTQFKFGLAVPFTANLFQTVFYAVVVLSTILIMTFLGGKLRKKLIQIRISISFIILLILFNSLLLFIANTHTYSHSYLILSFITLLMSIYINEQKKNYFFEALIIWAIAFQLYQAYHWLHA